jgi:hypothetical protein
MYSYEIVPEAREQVDGISNDALVFYAELIAFLELTPWGGPALPGRQPGCQHAPDGLRPGR